LVTIDATSFGTAVLTIRNGFAVGFFCRFHINMVLE
jgi:hypothetical protein